MKAKVIMQKAEDDQIGKKSSEATQYHCFLQSLFASVLPTYYLKCVYTKRKNSFKKLLNTDHQIENLIT